MQTKEFMWLYFLSLLIDLIPLFKRVPWTHKGWEKRLVFNVKLIKNFPRGTICLKMLFCIGIVIQSCPLPLQSIMYNRGLELKLYEPQKGSWATHIAALSAKYSTLKAEISTTTKISLVTKYISRARYPWCRASKTNHLWNVQANLVNRGLFICEFAYSHKKYRFSSLFAEDTFRHFGPQNKQIRR